jgi:zinc protease
MMGYHAPAFEPTNVDVPALEVLAELLFSERAPLYKRLVLKEQKVDQIEGSFDRHVDPNLFSIYARIKKPADLPVVEEAIQQEVARLAREGIDDKTLAEVASHTRYGFAGHLNTADNVALVGAEFIALTGRLSSIDDYFAAFGKVTSADVQRVARTYFLPKNRTVVTLKSGAP